MSATQKKKSNGRGEESSKLGKAPEKKKRKRSDDDFEFDEEVDFLPSHARRTVNGGYAHTSSSRSKIAHANKGNNPWNKGKNRSSTDKAKIAAGVRARNRSVLLKKLGELGMTEDEWVEKKKEVKYVRERLRIQRKKNAQMREEYLKREQTLRDKKSARPIVPTSQGVLNDSQEGHEIPDANEEGDEDEKRVFSRDIHWTPHAYGDTKDITYQQLCPQGGPGGLICCDWCCKQYSTFLSLTYKDLEQQKIAKVGRETKELLGFLNSTTVELKKSMQIARKKQIPSYEAIAGVLKKPPLQR